MFSYFKAPITNLIPAGNFDIETLFLMITNGSFKDQVIKIRSESDHKIQNKLKASTLDYVLFSATCESRETDAIYNHSGLIAIDLDDIPDGKYLEIKNSIISDPTISPYLIFESPSGQRLKAVFKIDIDQASHIDYFKAFDSYFLEIYGLKIDQQCKNISRACYLSHDPDAFFNKNCLTLDKSFVDTFNIPPQPKSVSRVIISVDSKNTLFEQVRSAIFGSIDGFKQGVLVKQSRLLGGYVGGNLVDYSEAYDILSNAINNRLGGQAGKKEYETVKWGLDIGQRSPIYEFPFKKPDVILVSPPVIKSKFEFPIDSFPDDMKDLILGISQEQELEIDVVAMLVLFGFGQITGNCFKIDISRTWKATTILWLGLIGPTGSNKTGHLSIIKNPFDRIGLEDYKIYQEQYDLYMQMPEKERKKIHPPVRYIESITDTTAEGLSKAMMINKKGIMLITGEGTGWISSMNRYNATNRPFWVESFDNKSTTVNRAGDTGTFVESPYCSIAIGLQTVKLKDIFGGSDDADGFSDRFLFVEIPERLKVWGKDRKSSEYTDTWFDLIYFKSKIARAKFLQDKIEMISLPDPVFQLRVKMMNEMELWKQDPDIPDAGKGFISKYITYLDRLSLCLAIGNMFLSGSDHPDPDKKCYELSYQILKWQRDLKMKLFIESSSIKEISNLNKGMEFHKSNPEKIMDLHKRGFIASKIAVSIGVSKQYVNKIIAQYDQKTEPNRNPGSG